MKRVTILTSLIAIVNLTKDFVKKPFTSMPLNPRMSFELGINGGTRSAPYFTIQLVLINLVL